MKDLNQAPSAIPLLTPAICAQALAEDLQKESVIGKLFRTSRAKPSRANRVRYWFRQEIGNRFELVKVALFSHRDKVDSALRDEEWP